MDNVTTHNDSETTLAWETHTCTSCYVQYILPMSDNPEAYSHYAPCPYCVAVGRA